MRACVCVCKRYVKNCALLHVYVQGLHYITAQTPA